jgi:hypothetical protein
MIPFLEYVGQHFIGKKICLKCDCIVNIDVTGVCTNYSITSNELFLHITKDNKTIKIGANSPGLRIEILH